MSEPVMADAQFGMAKILRPYENFNADYQGQNAMHPIMFTEINPSNGLEGWGQALDDLAGRPGYSVNLIKGLPVPLGARILLYLPIGSGWQYNYNDGNDIFLHAYTWLVSWRIRTAYCYRQNRTPYHLPNQNLHNFSTGNFIPMDCACQSIPYAQIELNKQWQPTHVHSYDGIQAGGYTSYHGAPTDNTTVLPCFIPGGTDGNYVNGIGGSAPTHASYEVQALGDEMILGLVRTDVTPPTVGTSEWNFNAGGTDNLFYTRISSRLRYGPRVLIGTAP